MVSDLDGGRRLDHDTHGQIGVEGNAGRGKLTGRAGHERLGAQDFVDRADHGEHDLDIAAHAGTHERAQLRLEKLGHGQRDTNRPPAPERVRLLWERQVGRRLVAADVQRANDDRPVAHNLRHVLVDGELLFLAGRRQPFLEEEFGAQEADAFGARFERQRCIGGGAQVGDHFDAHPIVRAREALRCGPGCAARFGRNGLCLGVDKGCVAIRLDDDGAAAAIQRQRDAITDGGGQLRPDADDGGDAHAAREDGRVRRRPAARRAEADDAPAVERGRLRRQQIVGDDDGVGRQFDGRLRFFAQQLEQAAPHVLDVGGALLEDGTAHFA